jgi:hypothetical protein
MATTRSTCCINQQLSKEEAMRNIGKSGLCLALLALCYFARTVPAAAQSYTITDLGALQGTKLGNDSTSSPYGLNNLGEAVGTSSNPSAAIATLFSNGTATSLGFLDAQVGDDVSIANAINDTGDIAGAALAGDGTA